MVQTESGSDNSIRSPIVRSNRPIRLAALACFIVFCTAVYIGIDVSRAIGQSKSLYEVAIPAIRIVSDIQNEAHECRHSVMHANATTDPKIREAYLAEFHQHQQKIESLLRRIDKLRIPEAGKEKVASFRVQWANYLKMPGTQTADPRLAPGVRDRQFQETLQAPRLIHDYLDVFSKDAAGALRLAFVRAGFELVLLLLGTLYTIAVLATNSEKRKTLESLRIMNQRLVTARGAAEESSKLKSEFLATVSHEIRTPMNGIIGMAELLAHSPLNAEQKCYNETVRASAEALLSILNDILDFSRMEAGKMVIDHVPFNPAEPAFQMADLLAPAAAQKELEFVVRIAPDLPQSLLGDAGRIRQVLMNLAGNAIKFTHSGHVMIEAEVLARDSKNCHLRFSVHDTGIGIPTHKIENLFEKFTQADASNTRQYGGTGLGLALSRKLVGLMGGEIKVDSSDGAGSVFSFDLVLPLAAGNLEPRASGPFAAHPPNILIIEPSKISAQVLAEMLDVLGASHRSVETGEAGAALIEADPAHWSLVLISSRIHSTELPSFVRIQRLLGKGNRLIVLAPRGRTDAKTPGRELRVLHKPLQINSLEDALRQTIIDKTSTAQFNVSAMAHDLQQLSLSVKRDIPGSTLRILVAEDNIVNQTIVRKLLEEAGCHVDLASNGRQAISQWEESTYDLILMDCQMPELDGFEATRQIRKREVNGRRVPIVAITANVLDKDRTLCFAAGMDDFLSKPLRLRQLQDAVNRWTSTGRDTPLKIIT